MTRDDGTTLECTRNIIHYDVIERLASRIFSEDDAIELAEFFKVFGDSSRMRIINALSCSELCVCDISELLSMSQSAVSHQLKILRQARLVKYRKEGKTVFYSLNDDHIVAIIEQGITHLGEER